MIDFEGVGVGGRETDGGLTLGAIARHMWKHGSPRSLPMLCLCFAVTAVGLAVLGAMPTQGLSAG
jgi:hypothetical protein